MGMETSGFRGQVFVRFEVEEGGIPMKMTSKPSGLLWKACRANSPFSAFSKSHLFFFMYVARSIMLTGLS
jgi:hypothetical protein